MENQSPVYTLNRRGGGSLHFPLMFLGGEAFRRPQLRSGKESKMLSCYTKGKEHCDVT